MGKFHDGKRRWNETIAAQAFKNAPAAALSAQKRYSGRTTKLSKTMKHVDEETRAIVRNARLESLEADNYGIDEADCITDQADLKDELYIDEKVKAVPKNNSPRVSKKPRDKIEKLLKARYPAKRLAQLVFEEFGHSEASFLASLSRKSSADQSNERYKSIWSSAPNYLTAAAKPSTTPARHFCCICGYFASYSCTRCGSRFCRIKCGDQHKKTGCLKFGL
ncbi:unnamed protein product [Albugo candida]|uniref:HIT-type domain-containing protein n=1 Tax=Albugo candida TaxID=65357 RepID=A0A024G906_9STRA|nr:unnamed protein product [Albugo candida]|eukprot:CCI42802.1 unnamed protein product [Albugo candida]